jgi:hypothetical protein
MEAAPPSTEIIHDRLDAVLRHRLDANWSLVASRNGLSRLKVRGRLDGLSEPQRLLTLPAQRISAELQQIRPHPELPRSLLALRLRRRRPYAALNVPVSFPHTSQPGRAERANSSIFGSSGYICSIIS